MLTLLGGPELLLGWPELLEKDNLKEGGRRQTSPTEAGLHAKWLVSQIPDFLEQLDVGLLGHPL